jgi:sec-independent protein translocase protein TatA
MPFRLGPTELIIILVIVLLLFGPGRIAKIAGELGRGIRSFKDGVGTGEDEESEAETESESKES